jgi:hypothetical protein
MRARQPLRVGMSVATKVPEKADPGTLADQESVSTCAMVRCTIKNDVLFVAAMNRAHAHQYFWFYTYPKLLAEAQSRSS